MKKISNDTVANVVGNVLILLGTAITAIATGHKSTKSIIEAVAKSSKK